MLDHLSYSARIDMHKKALIELFAQVNDNRNILIKDIKISRYSGADWKDFILQMIKLNGGDEVFSNEERSFTDQELYLLVNIKNTVDFKDDLKEAGVWLLND